MCIRDRGSTAQFPPDGSSTVPAAAQILFVLSSFSVLVAAVVIGGRHAILRGIFGSIDADAVSYTHLDVYKRQGAGYKSTA